MARSRHAQRSITAILSTTILVGVAGVASAAPRPKPKAIKAAKVARLNEYNSCESLLATIKARTLPLARPWGIEGYFNPSILTRDGVVPEAAQATPTAGAAKATAPQTEGVDYSGTNNQEAGVDEPDTVKTDGDRMYTVQNNRLYAVDLTDGKPQVISSLSLAELAYSGELLKVGDRLLLVGQAIVKPPTAPDVSGKVSSSIAYGGNGQVLLAEINISDPARMKVGRQMKVDGRYVSGRLTGSTARIVVSSQPHDLEVAYAKDDSEAAKAVALAANKAAITNSTFANWIPKITVQEAGGEPRPSKILGCNDIGTPPTYSGLGMLTVLTIDLAKGMDPVDADAVMTDGDLVYASKNSLYVATQRWFFPAQQTDKFEPTVSTQFHRFDIASPTVTDYKASGQVRGWLNNQFSMSEENGVLRVASTDAPPWWGAQQGDDPGSFVTTFAESGGVIAKLGQVGGLGKGERIYATRFIGDKAYVVTFRQIDPLYVVDLSRPVYPRVRGELKIQGFSAYLHPVGDGKLLGIGQDADANGRTKGAQVSLFDVSKPETPTRVDQVTVPDSWSSAQWDHHAFLYWPATGLAVLPVTVWPNQVAPAAGQPYVPQLPIVSALGLKVLGNKLVKVGSVQHPRRQDWATPIDRSLVANKSLFTISSSGVMSSSLDTLTKKAWDHFDTP